MGKREEGDTFSLGFDGDGAHHVLVAGAARNAAEETEGSHGICRKSDADGLSGRYSSINAQLRGRETVRACNARHLDDDFLTLLCRDHVRREHPGIRRDGNDAGFRGNGRRRSCCTAARLSIINAGISSDHVIIVIGSIIILNGHIFRRRRRIILLFCGRRVCSGIARRKQKQKSRDGRQSERLFHEVKKEEDKKECVFYTTLMLQRNAVAKAILTFELVLIFGYFCIDKFVHPLNWIGWIPLWMDGLMGMPKQTWLMIIGTQETLSAILILIPMRRVRQFACLFIVAQMAVILTQVGVNEMGARDFGILLSSLALFLLL